MKKITIDKKVFIKKVIESLFDEDLCSSDYFYELCEKFGFDYESFFKYKILKEFEYQDKKLVDNYVCCDANLNIIFSADSEFDKVKYLNFCKQTKKDFYELVRSDLKKRIYTCFNYERGHYQVHEIEGEEIEIFINKVADVILSDYIIINNY
jgi:hypothetical protein